MSETLEEDLRLVEAAGLGPNEKLMATTTISSLHFLKHLAKKRDVKIEEITARDVIDEVVSCFSGR